MHVKLDVLNDAQLRNRDDLKDVKAHLRFIDAHVVEMNHMLLQIFKHYKIEYKDREPLNTPMSSHISSMGSFIPESPVQTPSPSSPR